MEHYHEDDNRPAFVTAYMFTALCGAFMGFLAGILAGWALWH